ncbi:MAG: NAD(P)-dependent glycerol-3-phosphate dehydrogenase [Candidatus Omnitrophica bacterium]|nr:NAD(P)-dependent glycerol-3-phosphate dehydrogenase [Candidatus Omnitrophota bacterium]
MPNKIKNITVIGDGGWGTTLALHLLQKGFFVSLWGPHPAYLKEISSQRINRKFLPGIIIPASLNIISNLKTALDSGDMIVFAVPSKYAFAVLKDIKATRSILKRKIFLSVTKGIETKKLLRVSELVKVSLGDVTFAVLSGPTIASEVAKGIPSTAVVASRQLKAAKLVQEVFNSETFRIYTNDDVIGVELGGSVKNIIAIACGVCDGLGFGSNTKAALLTRGLAEMCRLGKALGAKQATFSGLSGLGDLVTTCFSPQSRNRCVGEMLGRGKSIVDINSEMEMVAEGVETVKAVRLLAKKTKISMPITEEIFEIIYHNKKPLKAVTSLMSRKIKAE